MNSSLINEISGRDFEKMDDITKTIINITGAKFSYQFIFEFLSKFIKTPTEYSNILAEVIIPKVKIREYVGYNSSDNITE